VPMSRNADQRLGYPEDLPEDALAMWPDLNRWPTPDDVASFKRATRKTPHQRLAVLNGLRSWAEIDIAPAWAWASGILTVSIAGLGVAVTVNVRWAQILSLVITGAAALVLLTVTMSLSTTADRRRRSAHVWLRAFESGL
jgi:hypothetical protein